MANGELMSRIVLERLSQQRRNVFGHNDMNLLLFLWNLVVGCLGQFQTADRQQHATSGVRGLPGNCKRRTWPMVLFSRLSPIGWLNRMSDFERAICLHDSWAFVGSCREGESPGLRVRAWCAAPAVAWRPVGRLVRPDITRRNRSV